MVLKRIAKNLAAAICVSLMITISAQAAPATAESAAESQSQTEAQTETVSESETFSDQETPSQTESTEEETQESETKKDKESKDKKKKKKKVKETEEETETETETETEPQTEPVTTNEELVQQQEIVTPPYVEETFRFSQIDKVYAVSRKPLSIRERMKDKSRIVGKIARKGLLFIIEEEEDGWYYVESGDVRGFVKKEDLILGKKAKKYVRLIGEEKMPTAKVKVKPWKNKALAYTRTTTQRVVAKKLYGIAVSNDIFIREEMEEETDTVGVLQEGGLCYILENANKDWVFVESDTARGFVKKEELIIGKQAREQVKANGEENYPLADIVLAPAENKACYYTFRSIKEGSVESSIRSSMVNFALQFVGNAYVWGGTSLTNGADCSGFVQSIYAEYGYSLPRVAEDQAQYGTKIPVEDALPGDLIFYARNGYIYHVVMCTGSGTVVEAQSSATGIVTNTVNYGNAVWATRIISSEDEKVFEEIQNRTSEYTHLSSSGAKAGDMLGTFKLTAYCACPTCCGVWSGGPTASGAMPVEGRTVAMAGVPFGTKLLIGDEIYTVEDRGTPYGHVDVFMNSHEEARSFGVQYADVYSVEE